MRVLVTGGGGFIGRRIVELLRERGDDVRFVARQSYPEVEATGATGLQVDLRNREAVRQAVAGVDAVIHTAAKAGYWGGRQAYWSTNVDGTRHILDALVAAGVPRLIYTSTPSVVGYDRDLEGIAAAPASEQHESNYPASKAVAERLVLEANSPRLATVALRPHLVFGPRDRHLLPRFVNRAQQGKLVIVGDGANRVDFTYVDNAAWAHLDALTNLTSSTVACAGKAYFISNGEPVLLWEWINQLLVELGIPPVKRKLSLRAARLLGAALELAWRSFALRGEPRMTRFLASGLARSHWYDMGPAHRDLGYYVRVPMSAATAMTIGSLRSKRSRNAQRNSF